MRESMARDAIVRQAASMFERGLTFGSSGNISVRLNDGWLMTPTGASMGSLDPASLSRLDDAGRHVDGEMPTKEHFMHLSMYRCRPSSHAVVHLHSTFSVAVACLAGLNEHDVLPPMTAYYVMRVGKLPLVRYFAPGDKALAGAIEEYAPDHHAMLLANHGPIVAGNGLSDAVDAIEELEETAKLFLLLKDQKLRLLTREQIAKLR